MLDVRQCLSNAVALGLAKKALCARFGFAGLYPLDGAPPPDAPSPSGAIYAACLAMMQEADCGIFNLTPFRGPSADVGTVLELGLMVAQGKPVFAYTNMSADLIDRLREACCLTFDTASGSWRDWFGMMAENFGNADNLMLDETLAAQGRKIHRRDVPDAARFTAMDGFVACLEEVADLRARGLSP